MAPSVLDDARRNDEPSKSGDDPVDTLRERYGELIDELRVILPGVQVLFAFLITAPFSSRFADLSSAQRSLYAVAMVTSMLALVVLLTPVAYHRLSVPDDREARISVAIRFKMAGLALLGCSLVAVLGAVASFVFSASVGVIAAVAAGATATGLWAAFPLSRRR